MIAKEIGRGESSRVEKWISILRLLLSVMMILKSIKSSWLGRKSMVLELLSERWPRSKALTRREMRL